jgi:hypothetical protein
LKLTLAPKI